MKADKTRIVAKEEGLGNLTYKLPIGILRKIDQAGYPAALELALKRTQVAFVAAAAHPHGGTARLAEYTRRLDAMTEEFINETREPKVEHVDIRV